METLCEVTVEIGGHRKDRENEIQRVCMVEWAFRADDFCYLENQDGQKNLLYASALGTLYEGEDKQEVIERIERAVWRANGGMCHVEVTARRLRRDRLEFIDAEEPELSAI